MGNLVWCILLVGSSVVYADDARVFHFQITSRNVNSTTEAFTRLDNYFADDDGSGIAFEVLGEFPQRRILRLWCTKSDGTMWMRGAPTLETTRQIDSADCHRDLSHIRSEIESGRKNSVKLEFGEANSKSRFSVLDFTREYACGVDWVAVPKHVECKFNARARIDRLKSLASGMHDFKEIQAAATEAREAYERSDVTTDQKAELQELMIKLNPQ